MKSAVVFSFILLTLSSISHAASDISVIQPTAQPAVMGAEQNFTGEVAVRSRFQREAPARLGGGVVTFSPAARTAWHTHPLGQTLFITAGEGWVQQWGKPPVHIKTGDVVWIPPEVKHWHGATATSSMSHLAVSEMADGKSVVWMEKVTDEQYPK